MAPRFIHDLFDARVRADADHPFLLAPDACWTFAHLARQVDCLADEMRALGVTAGDRVLIVAENCPEHVALILACSRLRAWSCGLNARLSRGEVAAFARQADARLCYFTSGESEAAARHADEAAAAPSVLARLRVGAHRRDAVAETGPLAERVAAVIFTSGTTGTSKGVLVSHAGLLQFAQASSASRALTAQDRAYAYLPMTHIFGLGTVLMASMHASSALLMRSRFDPADVVRALAHEGLSQLQGPPALFNRLMDHCDAHGVAHPVAPALRYLYTGAAPLDLRLKARVEAAFARPLHHGYGLSEYAGALCLPRLDEWRDDTAAGYLVAGGELRIVGPDGIDLPQGATGEIWMRGTGLMPGYFRDEAANRAAFREGGWYASGDLGRIGPAGELFVVGRLKEMIIRSGFNVYPVEVEAVLQAFAGVARAAVVGLPQDDGNEQIVAFLELLPQASLDDAGLRRHLDEHLAPYKRPQAIHVVDAFPMTHSGKILKRELFARLNPARP